MLFNNVIEETGFLEKVADLHEVDAAALESEYVLRERSFEEGNVTACKVIETIILELGCSNIDSAAIRECYRTSVCVVGSNLDDLHRYVSLGNRLPVVLANNEACDWDAIKHTETGYLDLFDCICSSWRMRAVKPSRCYFDRTETTVLGLGMPNKWVLIDDDHDNCMTAVKLGGRSQHFGDNQSLYDTLIELTRGLT